MAKDKSNFRTRNFATVVYPDSAPADWIDVLSRFFVPAFISPLHDLDVNPTGEKKKPHYHVILMFSGVKSTDQVRAMFDQIGGVGCEFVNSLRGYARYLCHLDNPEKQQYDQGAVTCLCGSDYADVIGLASDKYKALTEMALFCDQYDVTSFYLLSKYAFTYRTDWHRILCDCGAVYMREYLQSRKWSKDTGQFNIIDKLTGDIII